jgi:hypothetical protein
VVLLRHAEKPLDDTDADLSPRGRERAAALAVRIPHLYAGPRFLFASARSRESNRPVETLTPLASALKLDIDSRWKDDDFAGVAAEILGGKYDGAIVAVCWHHGKLAELAHALGVKPKPGAWDGAVFDQFWEITYGAGDAASISKTPQKLLFGDSPHA